MQKLLILLLALSISFSLCADQVMSWSSPTTLSTADVDAVSPLIVMDSSGNSTAIWLEGASLQASTLALGGSWSSLTTLSSAASAPQLGVDGSGNVIALWIEGGAVLSSSLPFNGSWSAPATLSNTGATTPVLAVQSSGNAVAVWTRSGHIESATQLFGQNWGAATVISGADADFPHVSIGSNGTVVAIWHRVISSADAIASSRATIGGAWGAETNLFQTSFFSKNHYPKVVVDSSGNATAIWFRYNQTGTTFSNIEILSSILPAVTTAWSIFPAIISGTGGLCDPAVFTTKLACDTNGNVIALWSLSSDGITFRIESAVKQAGKLIWKGPAPLVLLNPYAFVGDLSTSTSGNTLATYMYFDRTSMVVQVAESSSAGHIPTSWSIPANLSEGTDNGYPCIASALVGSTYYGSALWLHFDGTHTILKTSSGSRALIPALSNVSLVQSTQDFGTYNDYINTISWDPSTDPKVWGYVIYRNGILIACVLKNTLQFADHNRAQNEVVTYGISAIDDRFMQSPIVTVSP